MRLRLLCKLNSYMFSAPRLLFTSLYTCILFHAFINQCLPPFPVPCLVFQKQQKKLYQINKFLTERPAPSKPLDPLGIGLLSVT